MKPEWKEIDGEKWFKFNSSFDKLKYFYGHIISFFMIIFLLIACVYFYFEIYKQKEAFYTNPLIHGAEDINNQNNGIMSCQCIIERTDSPNLRFSFDAKGFYPEETILNYNQFKDYLNNG
jgi:hypothetical protein